jgi:hypothetical protein
MPTLAVPQPGAGLEELAGGYLFHPPASGRSGWIPPDHLPLLAAAGFIMIVSIVRACLQSVTIDEADSYLSFAAQDWPAYWYPSAANHVLNSILERIFTAVFGLSHLSLRAPALLGAAIYVAASYRLCCKIAMDRSVRLPLFVCCIANPFVMDYLVAARGYALALGFLMASVWAMSESRCAIASLCAGLSFCANFSFAYIAAALILVFTAGTLRKTRGWRTLPQCVFPGGLTAFLICGSTVWKFPREQLYYGSRHLSEMWGSIVAEAFGDLNPFLVHPVFASALTKVGIVLPVLVAALLVWQTLRIVLAGQVLGLLVARAIAIAVFCHWLALRWMRIPLPMGRTAIFFVPLALLLIGIGASLPARSSFLPMPRFVNVAVLSLCAVYFAGCLRGSYFAEWKFDSESKDVFLALEDVERREGIRDIATDWRYSSTLNFYRECFRHYSIGPFPWSEPIPPGRQAYVLYEPRSADFIRDQNLQVRYRGKLSGVVIAVQGRP